MILWYNSSFSPLFYISLQYRYNGVMTLNAQRECVIFNGEWRDECMNIDIQGLQKTRYTVICLDLQLTFNQSVFLVVLHLFSSTKTPTTTPLHVKEELYCTTFLDSPVFLFCYNVESDFCWSTMIVMLLVCYCMPIFGFNINNSFLFSGQIRITFYDLPSTQLDTMQT